MKTLIATLAVLLLLTACAGGGGSSEGPTTSMPQERQEQMQAVQAAIDAAEIAIDALNVLSTDHQVAEAQALLDAVQTAIDAGDNLNTEDLSGYAVTQAHLGDTLQQTRENIETARRQEEEGEHVDPVDTDEANRIAVPVEFASVSGSGGYRDYERYDGWGIDSGIDAGDVRAQFSMAEDTPFIADAKHKVVISGFLPDKSPNYTIPRGMVGTATWEGRAIAVHDDQKGMDAEHYALHGKFKMEVHFGYYGATPIDIDKYSGNNLRATVFDLQGTSVVGDDGIDYGASYPDLEFIGFLSPGVSHSGDQGTHFFATLEDGSTVLNPPDSITPGGIVPIAGNVGHLRGSF